ncbi:methyltransferase-like protein 27 isoform X1 [Hippocampus zosterae]|uniref:methyltransferase-like protein 27 isoform X1 n=1 Tax=Hippocampus zosterae TaxID=109293 RepID=UPI00223E2BCC|nr:methyltransferase-like protein 27 isoform X1 [Hippocampus zosterae]
MSSGDPRTFEMARDATGSVPDNCSAEDLMLFYDRWAQHYEQDIDLLEFRAPRLVAGQVAAHFGSERQAAMVLDVACGTGMAAKMMKREGFQHFVGVDGNERMLERARHSGLYRDLKMAMLGERPIPVPSDAFDVVTISGALSSSHIPAKVIRELWRAAKRGGLVCMSTPAKSDNIAYKVALEGEMKKMEDEGLWRRVEVTHVSEFQRGVSDQERGYVPGCVYLFQKL